MHLESWWHDDETVVERANFDPTASRPHFLPYVFAKSYLLYLVYLRQGVSESTLNIPTAEEHQI